MSWLGSEVECRVRLERAREWEEQSVHVSRDVAGLLGIHHGQ